MQTSTNRNLPARTSSSAPAPNAGSVALEPLPGAPGGGPFVITVQGLLGTGPSALPNRSALRQRVLMGTGVAGVFVPTDVDYLPWRQGNAAVPRGYNYFGFGEGSPIYSPSAAAAPDDDTMASLFQSVLVDGRFPIFRYADTLWGKWDPQRLDGLEVLVRRWLAELERGEAPRGSPKQVLGQAVRAELLYARDMFHDMAIAIRAVYNAESERHINDAHRKASEWVAGAWDVLREYGAEVVGAAAAVLATGVVTVSGVAAAAATGLAATGVGLGAGAIVLAGALLYDGIRRVLAGSTGAPPDVVPFQRTEAVAFRPGDADAYVSVLDRAMRRWRGASTIRVQASR